MKERERMRGAWSEGGGRNIVCTVLCDTCRYLNAGWNGNQRSRRGTRTSRWSCATRNSIEPGTSMNALFRYTQFTCTRTGARRLRP